MVLYTLLMCNVHLGHIRQPLLYLSFFFFFLRVHTLLVTYNGMKIVVRHFDESVQEFSTSI